MKKRVIGLVLLWGALAAGAISFDLPILFVEERQGKIQTGGCCRQKFELERGAPGEPFRIEISEDTPVGSGESLRACVWMAAVAVAVERGETLDGVRIRLKLNGQIDGPSMGAVTALAILSALDGKALPPDFAMTGTMLPDGSVGRVGGVALKLAAAASNGVTRVAIPSAVRFERQEDGTDEDLFALGRRLGIAVRPVSTLTEAVAWAAGNAVPPPLPDVELPPLPQTLESVLVRWLEEGRTRIRNDRERVLGRPKNEGVAFAEALFEGVFGRREKDEKPSRSEAERIPWLDALGDEGVLADCLLKSPVPAFFSAGRVLAACDAQVSALAMWDAYHVWAPQQKAFFAVHPELAGRKPLDEKARRRAVAAVVKIVADLRTRRRLRPFVCGSRGFVPWKKDLSACFAQFPEVPSSDEMAAVLRDIDFGGLDADAVRSLDDEALRVLVAFDGVSRLLDLFSDAFVRQYRDLQGRLLEVVPARPAGKGLAAAERLFHSALMSVQGEVDAFVREDLMDRQGEASGQDEDGRRPALTQDDGYFQSVAAVVDAHRLLERPETLADASFHRARLLSVNAELLARASAQYVMYEIQGAEEDDTREGVAVLFLKGCVDRARRMAQRNLARCRAKGIPCWGPRLAYERAEFFDRSPSRDVVRDVLTGYWAAAFGAQALVMGFE